MKERETKDMEKFQTECLAVYNGLKDLKVNMELSEPTWNCPRSWRKKDGEIDKGRFQRLTSPNKAATGLNYTRLMTRFLKWRREQGATAEEGASFDSHTGVLEFTEHLVQSECGYLTPRSFLYAVDYFSTAFGYAHLGGRWSRAKPLAASHAATKTTPVRLQKRRASKPCAEMHRTALDRSSQPPGVINSQRRCEGVDGYPRAHTWDSWEFSQLQ